MDTQKKSSNIENFGKLSLQIGDKLGKTVTEWFTGKPLTEEEKDLQRIRKQRAKEIKLAQEEAQYKNDLELARRGEYVPPEPKTKAKKSNTSDVFMNLGKHNPLGDFNKTESIGTKNFGVESYGGIGTRPIRRKDLEI